MAECFCFLFFFRSRPQNHARARRETEKKRCRLTLLHEAYAVHTHCPLKNTSPTIFQNIRVWRCRSAGVVGGGEDGIGAVWSGRAEHHSVYGASGPRSTRQPDKLQPSELNGLSMCTCVMHASCLPVDAAFTRAMQYLTRIVAARVIQKGNTLGRAFKFCCEVTIQWAITFENRVA